MSSPTFPPNFADSESKSEVDAHLDQCHSVFVLGIALHIILWWTSRCWREEESIEEDENEEPIEKAENKEPVAQAAAGHQEEKLDVADY